VLHVRPGLLEDPRHRQGDGAAHDAVAQVGADYELVEQVQALPGRLPYLLLRELSEPLRDELAEGLAALLGSSLLRSAS
jgi:hypothetical protein